MNVQQMWNLVRFHWIALVLAVLVGGVAGYGVASQMQVEYTARADVFVAVNNGNSTTSDIAQGATYSQDQAANFAAVATRELVLQPVIDDLGLDLSVSGLARKVTTTVPVNTSIISVAATDSSARRAAAIANGVASELSGSVDRLAPRSGRSSPLRIETVQSASPPTEPSAPRTNLLVVLGALGLLALVLLLLAARDSFRAKVRTAEQASALTGAPVVGTITAQRDVAKRPMALTSAPNSLRAEQYRQVRTNLRFLQMDRGHKVFVITSSIPGEAKSTTAANIAASFAAGGTRVCLVEADLRKPSLAGVLDLEGGIGLTTVITGEARLDEVLQSWGPDGLKVLLAGELPPNPTEVLGSARAEEVLNDVRSRFEVTVIDCPPLMPVSDAAILARLFGGALMVVAGRKVEVRELKGAVERMTIVEAPILGTIVTRSKEVRGAGGYYAGYVSSSTPGDVAATTQQHEHYLHEVQEQQHPPKPVRPPRSRVP